MTGVEPAALQEEIRTLFGSGRPQTSGAGAIGAEIELHPVAAGGAAPPESSHAALARLAADLSARGRFSFEPGGQLEYSTPACGSVAELVEDAESTLGALALRSATIAGGLTLVPRGLAPWFGPEEVGLREPTPRYVEMERYFQRLGPWGPWMMRLSASYQVNLDFGPLAVMPRRWRVANALAPVLVAVFANSPAELDDGSIAPCGRIWIWRHVDPSRTGALAQRTDVAPWAEYLTFALKARVMFDADFRPLDPGAAEPPSFNDWWLGATAAAAGRPGPTPEDWRAHLGTLFPDVRPRRWMEVRPIDVPGERWWAVPPALLAALVYDDRAAAEAEELLTSVPGQPAELTERAARLALRDEQLREAALFLFRIAEAGMGRFPAGYFGAPALATVSAFRERYVEAGRTQADEARERGEIARPLAEA